MNFSKFFMYIPGIIIFLVGSVQVRAWIRMHMGGMCMDGTIKSCQHVVKKDKKGREAYNFYNVVVEFTNPKTMHTERQAIKSPTEFADNQPVKVYKENNELVLADNQNEGILNPWVMMIGGALLILLALEENKGNEVGAMICLSIVLAGGGINLIVNYIKLKKMNLQVLDAEIIDVFSRQISKETKILKGNKYTAYPVVKFERDNQEFIRRCMINSSGPNAFKIGEHMNLYYDKKRNVVLEKCANPVVLGFGIALLVIGILAGASILSAIL